MSKYLKNATVYSFTSKFSGYWIRKEKFAIKLSFRRKRNHGREVNKQRTPSIFEVFTLIS